MQEERRFFETIGRAGGDTSRDLKEDNLFPAVYASKTFGLRDEFKLDLACARKQEEHLRRQGRRTAVPVEAFEERVLLDLFEHEFRGQAVGQPTGERRLADADRALYGDVARFTHTMREMLGSFRSTGIAATRPRPGMTSSGAISRRGNNTKFRSAMPGCGIVMPGESMTALP